MPEIKSKGSVGGDKNGKQRQNAVGLGDKEAAKEAERAKLTSPNKELNKPIFEKLPNELAKCDSTHTMLSSITNDFAMIEKYQNDCYERTKSGDLVIYDHEARITTFRSKNSKKASEMFLYQDLDFQELKKQLESYKFLPIIGCNEVKMRDGNGKVHYQ